MDLPKDSNSLTSLCLQETTEGPKMAKTRRGSRLSGAAKRRLRILMATGITKEEALKRKTPKVTLPVYQNGICLETTKPQAESNVNNVDSKVDKVWKIGIRNKSPMSEKQMQLLLKNLLVEMAEAPKKGEPLQFGGFSYKDGWVLIICKNKTSLEWLKISVKRLRPWPEAELSTLDEAQFPKLVLASCVVPSNDYISVESTFALLKTQNVGLDTDNWKPLSSKTVEQGQYLTFAIQPEAIKVLRKIDFTPNLAFSRVRVWITPSSDLDTLSEYHGDRTVKKLTQPRLITAEQPRVNILNADRSEQSRCELALPECTPGPSKVAKRIQATDFDSYPYNSSKKSSAKVRYNPTLSADLLVGYSTRQNNMPLRRSLDDRATSETYSKPMDDNGPKRSKSMHQ